MAQQKEQQSGRTIEVKTLLIAAAAAVVAAVVTSFFWKRGTLISTALTPVIVALTQEVLRRPAEKVSSKASRVTAAPVRRAGALAAVGAGRPAPPKSRFDARRLLERERGGPGDPEATRGGRAATNAWATNGATTKGAATNGATTNGAATNGAGLPPAPFDDTRSYDRTRSTEAGDRDAAGDSAPVEAAGQPTDRTVYGRKRFRWKVALLTGLLAFGIAAAALTVSELALGESIGGDGRTSLFSGGESGADGSEGDGSAEDGSDSSDPAESQSVPEGDGGSEPAPAPEEEAPVEEPAPEEPAEPVEPAPVAPAPAE